MEDVPVRRLSGNALNYAATTATVKRNGFTDCIVLYDILLIYFIVFVAGVLGAAHFDSVINTACPEETSGVHHRVLASV